MLKQRMELDTAYKGTQNNIQELQEKLRSLKAQSRMIAEDGNTFTVSEQGEILTDAKSKLLDLQLKEHELLIKYKEDSPPVKDVRKEIQMTKDFLAAQEKDVTSQSQDRQPCLPGGGEGTHQGRSGPSRPGGKACFPWPADRPG